MARHLSILRPLPTLAAALAGLLATGSLADELSWQGPHNGWVYDGLTNKSDTPAWPTPRHPLTEGGSGSAP